VCGDSGQAQSGVVLAELRAEGFDDKLVVGALIEAGDRHGRDEASVLHADGKAAAVVGVVGGGKAAGFEGRLLVLQMEANGVRTAVKAEDDVGLAADPFRVVGSGAGERGVEERLRRTAKVDDDGMTALQGERAETVADLPRGVFVEDGEDELTFLESDAGEVGRKVHQTKGRK